MFRTHHAPLPTVRGVSDALVIKRAEECWERSLGRSLADDLAAIQAAHAKREASRDRTLVALRVARDDRRADVSDRFEAAVALLAAEARARQPIVE